MRSLFFGSNSNKRTKKSKSSRMASTQQISGYSKNASARLLDHQNHQQQQQSQNKNPNANANANANGSIEVVLKKNSDAETSATTSSNEDKEKLRVASKHKQREREEEAKEQEESRQPQTVAQYKTLAEKRLQERRLREALDKELDALDLPKLEEQVKRIPRKAKNLDWVPDSIIITNRDRYDYDDDDESDNCSLISGLSLPQEISLLRQIADKHHHHTQQNKAKERKSSSSSSSNNNNNKKKQHNNKTSSSSSIRKTRNKVASNQISSKSAAAAVVHNIVAAPHPPPPRRRNSRPTTDAGDLKPDRAQNMEIEIKMNGKTIKGSYSGALSHNIGQQQQSRKPNGAGIIKFDNGDMYMGDMKDGQMHGHGTLVHGDTVLRGEFEHNMFVV
eukprot:CAMPEP_0113645322 /NCGR_PEP_ID=MMETSP0017_2-20120614/23882_1 /TAXON_ID=2856 /ORGANISM="Cylindrotheca closterium" /LENGTH=389 /DNA_ID=CAMNT_0000557037 /DNA_START=1 /DNA_END=1170 /DNA_ORIENTATION=+ /assembly_acc=CAM_ASM_000147